MKILPKRIYARKGSLAWSASQTEPHFLLSVSVLLSFLSPFFHLDLIFIPLYPSTTTTTSTTTKIITMASRVFTSRLAANMAATSKVARPAARMPITAATKRSFTNASRKQMPTTLQTLPKRTNLVQHNLRQAFANQQSRRNYSSEMANAMVEVSKNVGMGNAAIGLGGAGIGIGLVFAALLMSVSRNPALRGQLFTYAILGFAFVEAMGLFDLMVAMMCKYV